MAQQEKQSKEAFLLDFHDKLLLERKDANDYINYYLISCYGLLGVAILTKTGTILEYSIQGAKIDVRNVQILQYLVILIFFAYVVIFFNLLRIARLLHTIHENSFKIRENNESACVVGLNEISLFSSGVTGIIFSMTRTQIAAGLVILREMDKGAQESILIFYNLLAPFSIGGIIKAYYNLLNKPLLFGQQITILLLRFLLTLVLIYTPLLATILYILREQLSMGSVIENSTCLQRLWHYVSTASISNLWIILTCSFLCVAMFVAFSILSLSISRDLLMSFLENEKLSWDKLAKDLGLRK